MSHNYTENWNSSNAYWSYDGDENFSAFPGYLSTSAASTEVVFEGGASFDEWPHTIDNNYPLKIDSTIRFLCDGSDDVSLFQVTFGEDAGYSGDYITFNFSYLTADSTYFLDIYGVSGGNAVSRLIDLGLPLSADQTINFSYTVTNSSYEVVLDGFNVGDVGRGFSFSSVGLFAINMQNHDVNNKAMVAETQLYTNLSTGQTSFIITPNDSPSPAYIRCVDTSDLSADTSSTDYLRIWGFRNSVTNVTELVYTTSAAMYHVLEGVYGTVYDVSLSAVYD